MDIGKGDYVECIDDAPHSAGYPQRLVKGAPYVVREAYVGQDTKGKEVAALRLEGVALPSGPDGIEGGWDVARFRPFYRPKKGLITGLLTGVDELSEETLEAFCEGVKDSGIKVSV